MNNWTIEMTSKAIELEPPLVGPAYAVANQIVDGPALYHQLTPGYLVTLVSAAGARIRISGDVEIQRAFRAVASRDQDLLDQVIASGTPLSENEPDKKPTIVGELNRLEFHECVVSGIDYRTPGGSRFDGGDFAITLNVALDPGWSQADIDRIAHVILGHRVKMTLDVIVETDGGARSQA
jgi:hypothetical protein